MMHLPALLWWRGGHARRRERTAAGPVPPTSQNVPASAAVRSRSAASLSVRADRFALGLAGAFTAAMAMILIRVVQLQVAPGPRVAAMLMPRQTITAVPAPRGDVVDRNGRPLATTKFGEQVYVDPVEFPDPPDEAIARLAAALGVSADALGERIVARMTENRRRAALRDAARLVSEATPVKVLPLIRYVRVSDVVPPAVAHAVRSLRMPGVHLERRGVRAYPAQALAAAVVGKVGVEHEGRLGVEHVQDEVLRGRAGRLVYVRDAAGRPLWLSPGSYVSPRAGDDVRLSLDLEIQRIAEEELRRGVEEADAAGGRCVVMDPRTGEVLALADIVRPVPDAVDFPWVDATARPGTLPDAVPHRRYRTIPEDPGRAVHPALARNRCVEDVYEPGSTFKPFIWATATELGLLKPQDVLQTGNGVWRTPYGRIIRDVIRREQMTWAQVLMYSSNAGMAQAAERMTHDQMYAAVRRFGFGSRTGIGLPGEAAGLVTPRRQWTRYTQTSVAFGHEIAVTPIQMARAFCVFARSGTLAGTLPDVRLLAVEPGDPPPMLHRVLRPDVALLTRRIMHDVALAMESRMTADGASGQSSARAAWAYAMFGKSGTAEIPLGRPPPGKRRPPGNKGYYPRQYTSSFIAGAPLDDPRLVVLVIIDDPGPARVRSNTYYGALTAGPVVRRITERALWYLGVPPTVPPAGTARLVSVGE